MQSLPLVSTICTFKVTSKVTVITKDCCDKGVSHVFHVNRSVDIFSLNRLLLRKNMLTDLLT